MKTIKDALGLTTPDLLQYLRAKILREYPEDKMIKSSSRHKSTSFEVTAAPAPLVLISSGTRASESSMASEKMISFLFSI